MASRQYSISSVGYSTLTSSPNAPCQCCPYGFHIDTDFVRYCDALLAALNTTNKNGYIRRSSLSCSLRRDLNLVLPRCTKNDLFSPSAAKSFLSYCDYDYKHSHTTSLIEYNSFYNQNGYSPPNNQFSNSSNSIETDLSTPAFEAESMLTEAVTKFEEILLESKSSKLNLCNTSNSTESAHNSPPPSPTPSSCPSSTISKTVLSQIRNHLALSLTRVKELEEQVAQIPYLNQKISHLKSERDKLLDKIKVDIDDNKLMQTHLNHAIQTENAESIKFESKFVSDKSTCTSSADLPDCLSFTKCDSVSINEHSKKQQAISHRSIGTLTCFAPCLPPRNSYTQTNIKLRDAIVSTNTKVDCKYVSIQTDKVLTASISCQTLPNNSSVCIDQPVDGKIFVDYGSQTEFSIENILTDPLCEKVCADKNVSTSDLCSAVERPNSLDIVLDSSSQSISKSNLSSLICSSSSTSSSQSIRLCDKCNEMITSITSDNLYSQEVSSLFLPKIVKYDSGISVERRRADRKIEEHSDNGILLYPDSDSHESNNCENIQLTDDCSDSSLTTQSNRKIQRKPLDYRSLQPNNESKEAMKIINEHLLDMKKTNSFSFSKCVASVKKVWFRISSSEYSDSRIVESYLDCFEKFSNKLLEFIVNLNDSNGNTAMHYAISYNNFDIVSVLLDSKVCDVNKYNKAGYNATMLVSLAKIENEIYREVVVRLFRQSDLNLKAKQNGQTALMLAASHGRLEICKVLLDCDAEINLQDNDGSTALMCAAEHGHCDVISLLLSHPDCDPIVEDNEGSTALKIALVNGHNDVGILLYAGTRTAHYYGTPLHSSLSRLPNYPIYSGHLRRTGSLSHSNSYGQVPFNSSVLSLRNSPPRSRHSLSTPSSPSRH